MADFGGGSRGVPAQDISGDLGGFFDGGWGEQAFHGDGGAAQQDVGEAAHRLVPADVSDLVGAVAGERGHGPVINSLHCQRPGAEARADHKVARSTPL